MGMVSVSREKGRQSSLKNAWRAWMDSAEVEERINRLDATPLLHCSRQSVMPGVRPWGTLKEE